MEINYQQDAVFVGQDIDANVAMMAYIQLSLLGCPGYIKIGNSLTEPMTGHVLFGDGKETTFYTPMFFSEKMEFLRHMAMVRRLFQTVGGQAEDHPAAPEPQQAAARTTEAIKAKDPPTGEPAVIEVSKRRGKQAAGQLMFDFGE